MARVGPQRHKKNDTNNSIVSGQSRTRGLQLSI